VKIQKGGKKFYCLNRVVYNVTNDSLFPCNPMRILCDLCGLNFYHKAHKEKKQSAAKKYSISARFGFMSIPSAYYSLNVLTFTTMGNQSVISNEIRQISKLKLTTLPFIAQ